MVSVMTTLPAPCVFLFLNDIPYRVLAFLIWRLFVFAFVRMSLCFLLILLTGRLSFRADSLHFIQQPVQQPWWWVPGHVEAEHDDEPEGNCGLDAGLVGRPDEVGGADEGAMARREENGPASRPAKDKGG